MNVLAIGCHPDDLEVACVGTLAKYAKRGDKVFMCHITNGNMGHVVIEPDELAVIRNKEAEDAAGVIGAEAITLDIGDGRVDGGDREIIRKLVEAIRYAKPDVIITHNPHDYMQDHMEASRLAYNASFLATIPHFEEDTGPRHELIAPLFYMDTLAGINFQPTEYVDITDEIELKIQALDCHVSQIKWMADHDHIDFLDFVRTCSKFRGLQAGVPYAEGFRPYAGWPRFTTKRLLP